MKTWFDYILFIALGLLGSAVFRLATGNLNPGATWNAVGLWFLIFLLWWLLLQRKPRTK